jgi:hypothetical protein
MTACRQTHGAGSTVDKFAQIFIFQNSNLCPVLNQANTTNKLLSSATRTGVECFLLLVHRTNINPLAFLLWRRRHIVQCTLV